MVVNTSVRATLPKAYVRKTEVIKASYFEPLFTRISQHHSYPNPVEPVVLFRLIENLVAFHVCDHEAGLDQLVALNRILDCGQCKSRSICR
jgi:hypothetical protein